MRCRLLLTNHLLTRENARVICVRDWGHHFGDLDAANRHARFVRVRLVSTPPRALLDLRQLAHFVAVAEDGSFTRAARRMNIVQSGISSSIAGLERDLGVTLFIRAKHSVELTPPGRALLVEARRALAAVAAGRIAAVAAEASLSGHLDIGVARAVPRRLQLARVLDRFQLEHPDVTVTVNELVVTPGEALRAGSVDLVIGPDDGDEGVRSLVLLHCEIVLACAKTHPFASRRSIRLRAVQGERLISYPRRWPTQVAVERAVRQAGIEYRPVIEVNSLPLVLQLVEQGTCVAFVPEALTELGTNVAFIPLRPALGPWKLTASYLGEVPRKPAARTFLDMLAAGPTERRRP